MHIVWKIYIVKLDIPLSFLQWIHDAGVTPSKHPQAKIHVMSFFLRMHAKYT